MVLEKQPSKEKISFVQPYQVIAVYIEKHHQEKLEIGIYFMLRTKVERLKSSEIPVLHWSCLEYDLIDFAVRDVLVWKDNCIQDDNLSWHLHPRT